MRHASRSSRRVLGLTAGLILTAGATAGASTDTTSGTGATNDSEATSAVPGAPDDTTGGSSDTAGDASSSAGGGAEINVTDEGDTSKTYDLRGTYEVGQKVTVTLTMNTTVELDSQDIEIDFELVQDAEVVEVADDGGHSIRYEVTDASSSNSDLSGPIEEVVGVAYIAEFDADGTNTSTEVEDAESLSPTQAEFAQQIASSQAANFATPEEPVGVGALWDATVPMSTQGMSFQPTYHYELVGVTDNIATVTNEYDADVDQNGISGNFVGSGEYTIDLDNPLDLDFTATQDADLKMGGQDGTMKISIESVSEPA